MKDNLLNNRIVKLPSSYIQRRYESTRDYNIINLKFAKDDKIKTQALE